MPKLTRMKTHRKGDKVVVTTYQSAARGRHALYATLTLPRETCKKDIQSPENLVKLGFSLLG